MTASRLLAAARPFGPTVEADGLSFAHALPPDLHPLVQVVQTGVRAVLGSRRWYGCDSHTGRVIELSPALPIPDGVSLLAAEGDSCWDRIHPAARLDHPGLFVPRRPRPI
jgi:hypothetical protein